MEMKYTFDENIVSDLHKEAYGFRPTTCFWDDWSLSNDDRKQRIWDDLLDTADREAEREREMQIEAEQDVESRIQSMMLTVAGSTREDAIRYLHDAYDTNGDREYLEYRLGVRYGYLSGSVRMDLI